MDVHGNIVNKVSLMADIPITELVWNCEKFNMEERDDTTNPFVDNKFNSRLCVLATCFKNGDIKLLQSYDDVSPVVRSHNLLSPSNNLQRFIFSFYAQGFRQCLPNGPIQENSWQLREEFL